MVSCFWFPVTLLVRLKDKLNSKTFWLKDNFNIWHGILRNGTVHNLRKWTFDFEFAMQPYQLSIMWSTLLERKRKLWEIRRTNMRGALLHHHIVVLCSENDTTWLQTSDAQYNIQTPYLLLLECFLIEESILKYWIIFLWFRSRVCKNCQ